MSKFCANCGAQADDAAAVCGNCGAPFGATPAADTDVSGKGIGGIKKFIKPAIALIVAAVIIVLGICTISNFTGAKGAARKYCSAIKKNKASAVAKVLSIRYGEDEDDLEDYAERFVSDEDEDDYKISYKIKEAKKVSSSELKAIKKFIKNNTDEDDDYVKAAKKVKITVTEKEKKTGDSGRYTTWVVFTKEKGKWKYFGSYYEVENMAKGKSNTVVYSDDYDDYDDEDYYDDEEDPFSDYSEADDDDYSDYFDDYDDYDW